MYCCISHGNYDKGEVMNIQPGDISRGHFWLSLVKSGIRIAAGFALVASSFVVAGVLLIAAEVFGILEEMI